MSDLINCKCKTCGEPINPANAQDGIILCSVCNSVFILPKQKTSLNLLLIADNQLNLGKFDEAFQTYRRAAENDETEPEAYFGMALASHKVRYVNDVVNKRLQPICYDYDFSDFKDDKNYLKALSLATPTQRTEYMRRAEEIDYIKKEFSRLQSKGVNYDCFICVKVTETDGSKMRTTDYKYADDIYFDLRGKGFKPFFSERELSNVSGADYEARILYALVKSECMLVVCSNPEYLQTPWVQNEYSRFLKLVNDEEKDSDSITVAYLGKPIEKLAGKNGKIQGIDLSAIGAAEKIRNFVETHTPQAKRKQQEAEAAMRKNAEQEMRAREEAERARNAENEALKQKLAELEQKLSSPSVSAAAISDEDFYERYERIRKEKEEQAKREQAEREELSRQAKLLAERERRAQEDKARREQIEAERKAREEALIKERERREQEEKARREQIEAERKAREERERRLYFETHQTLENYLRDEFEIEGTVLKKHIGKRTAVTIPTGVTEIANSAFEENVTLESVAIPNTVTKIGEHAFFGCTSLASVNISDSVINIGDFAFSGCESLESITIPSSVVSIGVQAFNDCKSLKGLTFNKFSNLKSIGELAFAACESLTSITLPDGVESLGWWAFSDCKSLKSISIPASVKTVDKYLLDGCTALEEICLNEVCKKNMKAKSWNKHWLDGLLFVGDKKWLIQCIKWVK